MDEEDAFAAPEENNASEHRRDLSPVPPKPVPTAPRQRESLDGETIFAVGEDGDKWSDDDDEEESHKDLGERERLTKRTD